MNSSFANLNLHNEEEETSLVCGKEMVTTPAAINVFTLVGKLLPDRSVNFTAMHTTLASV